MTPTHYTSVEGSNILRWRKGSISKKLLRAVELGSFKAIVVKGMQVHSFHILPFPKNIRTHWNTQILRWDCINGYTKIPRKYKP